MSFSRLFAISSLLLWIYSGHSAQAQKSSELYLFQNTLLSDESPFWLTQQRLDRIPGSTGLTAGFLYRGGATLNGSLNANWGVEASGRTDVNPGDAWLSQAWLGVEWEPFHLTMGRWRQSIGVVPEWTTAGATVWSENARPMTRIQIGLPDFTPVPLAEEWFVVRGAISHGWFDGGRDVDDFFMHEKHIHGIFGVPEWPEFYFGIVHAAQWGGYDKSGRYGQMPSDLEAWWRTFVGLRGGPKAPDQFQENRFGNTLGSWQTGLMLRRDRWEVWLRKETIFEDHSGLMVRSPEDGVAAIHLRFRHHEGGLKHGDESWNRGTRHLSAQPGRFQHLTDRPLLPETRFNWEFWHTKSQSGPGPADPPDGWTGDRDPDGHQFGGQDDYFSHGIYKEGWTHDGQILGTPLIGFDPETERIFNNRFIAHHVSVLHRFPWRSLQGVVTWSRNYGRYLHPFPNAKTNTSLLLVWEESLYRWTGEPLSVKMDLAMDLGSLYESRRGVLISLGWRLR